MCTGSRRWFSWFNNWFNWFNWFNWVNNWFNWFNGFDTFPNQLSLAPNSLLSLRQLNFVKHVAGIAASASCFCLLPLHEQALTCSMISRRQQHAFVFWCVTLLRGALVYFQGYTIKGFRSQSSGAFGNPVAVFRATARVQGRVCRGRRQEAGV